LPVIEVVAPSAAVDDVREPEGVGFEDGLDEGLAEGWADAVGLSPAGLGLAEGRACT
jgi:hypothetical protein